MRLHRVLRDPADRSPDLRFPTLLPALRRSGGELRSLARALSARAFIAPIAVIALVGCGSTNAGVSSVGADTAAANTATSTGDTTSTSAANTTVAEPTTAPAATTLPATTASPATSTAGAFTIPQAPPATVDPGSVTTTAATPAPTQPPIDTGAPGVFTSDAAQFSIQFEATPSQTDASKNGATVTLFDVSTRTHEQTVSVLVLPTTAKSHAVLLNDALQGSVNSGSMTDLTKQSTTFQGQDALEFTAKISPNLTVLGRLVVTSARLYEELFVFDDSSDRTVAGHQFLDTLTLLGI